MYRKSGDQDSWKSAKAQTREKIHQRWALEGGKRAGALFMHPSLASLPLL